MGATLRDRVIAVIAGLARRITLTEQRCDLLEKQVAAHIDQFESMLKRQATLERIGSQLRQVELRLDGIDRTMAELKAFERLAQNDRELMELLRSFLLRNKKQIDLEVEQLRQKLAVATSAQNTLRQLDRRKRKGSPPESGPRRANDIKTIEAGSSEMP
ncbi:MAG: hypothetical protein AAF329_18585 [Cyanobacteria bacterium P01_A01_bin.17]